MQAPIHFFEIYLIARDGQRARGNYGRKLDCRILNNPAGLEFAGNCGSYSRAVIETTRKGFVKF